MIETNINIMMALGVFIVTIMLLVIVMLFLHLKKKQSRILDCVESVVDAIKKLNTTVATSDEVIMNNFKEISSKTVIIDSKQTSIKDMLDTIAKGIEVYSAKTMSIISSSKPKPHKRAYPNKPRSERNTPKS